MPARRSAEEAECLGDRIYKRDIRSKVAADH